MPNMFQTDSMDEDAVNPPPRFRVGAMGPQMRNMNPRMLMQLLQAKMQQQMVQKKQAELAKMAMMKQAQQAQIIGQMTPEEQRDAQMFGIKYVADRRKARESQGATDRRFLEGQDRSDARTGARLGARAESDAAKDALSKMLLGNTLAEVQGRAPVMSHQDQLGMDAMGPAMQAAGQGGPMGQAADMLKQHLQGVGQKRIIQKAEWEVIRKAQEKAGVAPTVPKGFVLEEDLNKQNKEFDKDREKAQQKAQAQQAFEKFVEEGANPDEQMEYQLLSATLGPEKAIRIVDSKRTAARRADIERIKQEKKDAKTDAAKSVTDAERLLSEIAKLEKENLAETEVKDQFGNKKGMKKKLSDAQIEINNREIERKRERLKKLDGDTTGNPRHDELLRKFEGGSLSPEEQMELDKYERYDKVGVRREGDAWMEQQGDFITGKPA